MSNYNKNDPKTIQLMFNSISTRYDLTNAVLSFQLHKYWNRSLVCQVKPNTLSHTLVDLCCGTGDIAFDYLKTTPNSCQAYLVDFCSGMLACAQQKCHRLNLNKKHQISYIEADVQQLPLESQCADCVTMAYGIRNVKDPSKCIAEAFRILKPGGCFGILELTQPTNRFLRLGHYFYLKVMFPLLGKLLTANKEAYQYLRNSIHTFILPAHLEKIMQDQGFIRTSRKSLAGGIATILIGHKPG